MLAKMESDGYLEGGMNHNSDSKIWRLTLETRKELVVKWHPVALTKCTKHLLAVGDAFLDLYLTGEQFQFKYEAREKYKLNGKEKTYAPDAIFAWRKQIYMLEVQISPLSKEKWAEKHRATNDFFGNGFHRTGQTIKLRNIPKFLIITSQQPENVRYKSEFDLLVYRNTKDFIDDVRRSKSCST